MPEQTYTIRLTQEQIQWVRRTISAKLIDIKFRPLPEDTPEESKILKEVSDILWNLSQTFP